MNAPHSRPRDKRPTQRAAVRTQKHFAHRTLGLVAMAVGVACSSSRATPRERETEQRTTRQSEQQSGPARHADSGHAPARAEQAGNVHARDQHDADAAHQHHTHGAGYHMDFSEVERFARHFDGPERDAWQRPEHVIELMGVEPGFTVADIGAGTGYFVGPLARAVGKTGRVLALDVEPNMVEYIRRRAKKSSWSNVEARVVQPHDPELAQGTVDRILIVNTWHHIDDRPQYSRKLSKALRPKGAIYIVDFTAQSDVGPPAKHRLSAEVVMQELRGGGLTAEIAKEDLPKQYIVRARLKQ